MIKTTAPYGVLVFFFVIAFAKHTAESLRGDKVIQIILFFLYLPPAGWIDNGILD